MKHPFQFLLPERRSALLWGFGLFTLLVFLIMNFSRLSLTTSAAPYGIISLQIAGSVENVERIFASWNEQARLEAAFNLGLDYLFLCLYATTFALACLASADRLASRGWPLASWGIPLAWGLALAAVLDTIENFALWRMLSIAAISPWPQIALFCAAIKFALIFAGMVYSFLGLTVKAA